MPVTDARKALVANRIKFAESNDSSVLTRNPRAITDERVSVFDEESAANNVANEIISLFGPRRDVYVLEYKGKQYQRQIGDTIRISHSGVGLSNADGIIISLQEKSDGLTTIVEVFV